MDNEKFSPTALSSEILTMLPTTTAIAATPTIIFDKLTTRPQSEHKEGD